MKNRTKIIIAFFIFFVINSPELVKAQKYPLELSRSLMEGNTLKSGIGTFDIKHDHASLILPILPLDSFIFLIYLKEDQKNVTYDDFQQSVTFDSSSTTYQSTDFPDKLVNSTRGALLAIPLQDSTWIFRRDEILATDQKDVNEEDRSFMNQFLYRPKTSEKGKWTFGFSHLGGIAKEAYIPLVGYSYNGELVRINSVLPAYFILQFKLGEYAYILIDETVTAESYRLSKDSPWDSDYLSIQHLTSRLEVGVRFGDFEIGVSYGVTNFHSWIFMDQDHDELEIWDLEPGAVTSIQIQWNL